MVNAHLVNAQLTANKFLISERTSLGAIDKNLFGTYGISVEYLIKNRFGLIYNLEGVSKKESFTLHTPLGLPAGAILMTAGVYSLFNSDSTTESSTKFGIIGGLFLLTLPDGITYHQTIGYKWDISPYANLLGLDFIFERNKLEKLKYACSFGVKTSYLLTDKLFCYGFIESRKTGGVPWGFGMGVGIGMTFKKESSD